MRSLFLLCVGFYGAAQNECERSTKGDAWDDARGKLELLVLTTSPTSR